MIVKLILLFISGRVALPYLFRLFFLKQGCPVCGNPHPDQLLRSKRLTFIPFKAYHCMACGKRFYRVEIAESSAFTSNPYT
ncbi:hypothetical protein GO730_00760 [Spirosoma sp. HMF3257]|uniref:hypothetical protein n=1 Tax=Spirosoma telluris TaxID=2183553 RepID=UPI0011B9490E|nr:hypothetical protein [Spirosoma telluris]